MFHAKFVGTFMTCLHVTFENV